MITQQDLNVPPNVVDSLRRDDVWDCENFERWVMSGMYAWIQTDIRKSTMRAILIKCADYLK